MYYAYFDTPAGTVLFTGDSTQITGVHWKVFKRAPLVQPGWQENLEVFAPAIQQLTEYFRGQRTTFDLHYAMHGTDFQKRVWNELVKIPFGQKTSYSAVAAAIGNPRAVRAVGTAVGSNPISIIVPCHRVLTSSNTLGGYAGGLPSKRLLLQTENIPFALA